MLLPLGEQATLVARVESLLEGGLGALGAVELGTEPGQEDVEALGAALEEVVDLVHVIAAASGSELGLEEQIGRQIHDHDARHRRRRACVMLATAVSR